MLLILSAPDDTHSEAVEQILARRGIPFLHWNQAGFPERDTVSLRYDANGLRSKSLVKGSDAFDLSQVSTTYVRRHPHPNIRRPVNDPRARAYIETEARSLLNAAAQLSDCRWVPGPVRALHWAGDKAWQLRLAARLGFSIPHTLITNDPAELLEFHREHNGKLVCKALNFPHFPSSADGSDNWLFTTQLVSPRDVGYAESVRYCPAIFQAYVPKQLELRITVVGDRVFPCEIHSQERERTRYDWRRYDLEHTPHHEHALPPDIAARCIRIVRELGLCYGALDLVLTPDGRYVFLEVNPMGQFLWIEKITGMPISEAICDLLEAAEAGVGGMPSD
ncbi:MAG: ATP-dependent carboxylate-amine ligase [Gemmatimonadetes bacterium]|nr:ATP-dependent carboxylate-amine ligase [Gemmatimonadota bacterium]